MSRADHNALAAAYDAHRRALVSYATRMVARPDVAEELVQQAAVRLLESESAPTEPAALRAWLFRTVSNLAIDHRRRHATWREGTLAEAADRVTADETFVADAARLVGSPEIASIARQHLIVCFACTLRNVPPEQAAALLLKDVYGFSVEETAAILDATFAQAKNWLQSARATMDRLYADTCRLVNPNGKCFQCAELSDFFRAPTRNPLAQDGTLRARLRVLRADSEEPLGPFHHTILRIVDDLLSG